MIWSLRFGTAVRCLADAASRRRANQTPRCISVHIAVTHLWSRACRKTTYENMLLAKSECSPPLSTDIRLEICAAMLSQYDRQGQSLLCCAYMSSHRGLILLLSLSSSLLFASPSSLLSRSVLSTICAVNGIQTSGSHLFITRQLHYYASCILISSSQRRIKIYSPNHSIQF
jgi:hypothetical protein